MGLENLVPQYIIPFER